MIKREDYIETGQILRTYGISGALAISINLNYNPFENYQIDYIFIDIDGSFVPFHIQELQAGSGERWIIQLEDISDPKKAALLCKRTYYVHKDFFPSSWQVQSSIKQIEGFKIVDIYKGELGIVQSLGGTADNPLVVFKYDEMEVLLPVNEQFIKNIDFKHKIIKTIIPDDLLYLNP